MNIWQYCKRLLELPREHNIDEEISDIKARLRQPAHQPSQLETECRLVLEIGREADRFKAAARLLISRNYPQAVEAYRGLAAEYPERRDFCELQIARAYALQGMFQKSLDYYQAARVHGADERQMDESVWELCESTVEAADNAVGKVDPLHHYLTLFPNGMFAPAARDQLRNLPQA